MAGFDVVLLGATGSTGGRALPYLAERAAELGVMWAVAGRDPQRLYQATADLPPLGMPEVFEVDLDDPAQVASVARAGNVVCNLAGPYRRTAPSLLAACAAAGTHYLDVTGELDVVRDMVAANHEAARASGTKLVQVAGFESLPFDLAVAAAADAAGAAGSTLVEVEVLLSVQLPPGLPRLSDGVSSGTFRSLLGVLGSEDAGAALDPALLLPPGSDAAVVRSTSPVGTLPRLRGASVVVPMAPSPFITPAVVQRSHALRSPGTPPLRYREGIALGDGLLSLPLQLALAAPLATAATGFRAFSQLAPGSVRRTTARALDRLAPVLGDGPGDERVEGWRWRLDVRGLAADGGEHRVVVDADGHPGYLATSRMAAEAALLLADGEADLPDTAGLLTPAAALGTAELRRFDRARVRFRTA